MSPESLTVPELDAYTKISHLDPLGMDDFFTLLPEINQAKDTEAISTSIEVAIDRALNIDFFDRFTATATLRDFDFLLSSAVRHGLDPVNHYPGLAELLVTLGRVAETVPRGTVTTYAVVNPIGERQRTFTGSDTERIFIDAVARGAVALEGALETLANVDELAGMRSINTSLDVMISSIVAVKRNVSPEFFTNELRPYFDPIEIQGRKYLGAGGAQLQFVALDFALWGVDDDDAMYRGYFDENKDYLTAAQKEYLASIIDSNNGQSLITSLVQNPRPEVATECLEVLKKLKKFRYPHRKVARDNFQLRGPGDVGSGSYTTNILDVLIDKIEDAYCTLVEIVHE